jgi:hypothetical protein
MGDELTAQWSNEFVAPDQPRCEKAVAATWDF